MKRKQELACDLNISEQYIQEFNKGIRETGLLEREKELDGKTFERAGMRMCLLILKKRSKLTTNQVTNVCVSECVWAV